MKFTINTRILEHLGEDLITSKEVAISELIKNSYDANAKEARLHFITDFNNIEEENFLKPLNKEILSLIKKEQKQREIIVIEDSGKGMGLYELQDGFFTIGTDIKLVEKENTKYGITERIPLGEKGIGRLASQRLSNNIIIETTKNEDTSVHFVMVNWSEFRKYNQLDQIELNVQEFQKENNSESYTRIWLVNLFEPIESYVDGAYGVQLDLFGENKNKVNLTGELQSTLSFLLSPFEKINDFYISVMLDGEEIPFNFQNEITSIAESIHSFDIKIENDELKLVLGLEIRPWYLERIHNRIVGDQVFKMWRKSHTFYGELLDKYKSRFLKALNIEFSEKELYKLLENKNIDLEITSLKQLSPIEGKIFSFKRIQKLLNMAVESAFENKYINKKLNQDNMRSFLDYHNGIKLYRGKARVATLGDRENDWLHLQQSRTKGQQFFRFELGNTIGYIKINDPYQLFIREISSRLNFRTNEYSETFKVILHSIFHHYFYEFSRTAYYLISDILKEENLIPTNSIEELSKNIKKNNEVFENNKRTLKDLKEAISIITQNIDLDTTEKVTRVKSAINNLSSTTEIINKNIELSIQHAKETENTLKLVENERKLIELETYNNLKLMANGLITEIITHELHSILSGINLSQGFGEHFRLIEDFLINEINDFSLYNDHVFPIQEQFDFITGRMLEMSSFYSFLEKTFLFKGNSDDFTIEDLHDFLQNLKTRLEPRLKKDKVSLIFSTINMNWKVPKGVLVHIFYNLIDNSLYWIRERRLQAIKNKFFTRLNPDSIIIRKVDQNTIEISDTGTGVIPRFEDILFQPLETGKDRNGRGMGLYIVKKLLNSFGADIELLQDKNDYDRRFIFRITLNVDNTDAEGGIGNDGTESK